MIPNQSGSESFKVGLFDLPTLSTDEDFQVLSNADVVCAIISPNVATINNTKKGMEFLAKVSNVSSKTVVVLNKADEAYGLTKSIFTSQLGIEVFAEVDKDDEAMMTYEQKGKLLDNKSLLVSNQLKNLTESLMAEFF